MVPTRPFEAPSEERAVLGRGTAEVTATFLDPRTLEIVDEVAVGSTLEEAWYRAAVAVSPDRGLVAVASDSP